MVSDDINEESSILQDINLVNQELLSKYMDNVSTAILMNGISKWIIIIIFIYHYNYTYGILEITIDLESTYEYIMIFLLSIFVPTYIFSSGYILATNIEKKKIKNKFNLDSNMLLISPIIFFLSNFLASVIKSKYLYNSHFIENHQNLMLRNIARPGFLLTTFLLCFINHLFRPISIIFNRNYDILHEYNEQDEYDVRYLEQKKGDIEESINYENNHVKSLSCNDKIVISRAFIEFGVILFILYNISDYLYYMITLLFMFCMSMVIVLSKIIKKEYHTSLIKILVVLCFFSSIMTTTIKVPLKSFINEFIINLFLKYLMLYSYGFFSFKSGFNINEINIFIKIILNIIAVASFYYFGYPVFSPLILPFYVAYHTIIAVILTYYFPLYIFSLSSIIMRKIEDKTSIFWYLTEFPSYILYYVLPLFPIFEAFINFDPDIL